MQHGAPLSETPLCWQPQAENHRSNVPSVLAAGSGSAEAACRPSQYFSRQEEVTGTVLSGLDVKTSKCLFVQTWGSLNLSCCHLICVSAAKWYCD